MEEHFVTYEQALALKELGFDEPCFGCFTKSGELSYDFSDNKGEGHYFQDCTAPLKSQVFKWFRYKGFDFAIMEKYKDKGKFYGGYLNKPNELFPHSFGSNFKTYEEAELACIDTLIEIIKTK